MAGPAQSRKKDFELVPRAAELLAASLNRAQKALGLYRAGESLYDHWTPEEAKTLEDGINGKKNWLDSNVSRVRSSPKTKDIPVKAAIFSSEQQV